MHPPRAMWHPASNDILRRLPSALGRAVLTFDDGPDPEHTPRVLDVLAAAGVRATFFLVASAAERHPLLARRMLAEGHEIGNHTRSHYHPALLRDGAARREVIAGSRALADILGYKPRYFRPPFGHLRRCMTETAHELGETVVLWSLSAKDWGPFGRVAPIARRLARARVGDIVLLHDARWRYNRPWATLEVLASFVTCARATGMQLDLLDIDAAPSYVTPRGTAPTAL
jgi:peptidoglycan-N-acetylglucosamine deacetylase